MEAVIADGMIELPPAAGIVYAAFCDPSGGSADSMTVAIGHMGSDGIAVLDAVRERRPPFSPEAAITEIATLAKNYHCFTVTGDRFAGGFPPEVFNRTGLTYESAQLPRAICSTSCCRY